MTHRLRRREFITLLGGAFPTWPLSARAQSGRTYRLGILHNQGPQAPQFPPFYDELSRLAGLPDPLCATPRHLRAHGCAALASHLPVAGVRRGGWIDRLWSAHHPDVPAIGAA